MQVFNAMQLKAGAKSETNRMGSLTQPLQLTLLELTETPKKQGLTQSRSAPLGTIPLLATL